MYPQIFKDSKLQEQFDTEGYVIIPLLDKEDIEKLTTIFHEMHRELQENRFGASSGLQDINLKHQIRDTLYPVYLPYFEKTFKEYTYFGSSFLYKTPGKNSDLAPHQDWTIVEEKNAVAINIWTPLCDTSEENGTLYVVPKSQTTKLFSLRAPTIPFYFQKYFSTVIKCAVPTNAKAGHAVVLNQSLIHYSSPNLSRDIRIAITSGIKTKDAPMLFHFKNERNEIERYQMPEDFLLSFKDFQKDIYLRPENGTFVSNIPYMPPSIGKFKFIQQFGKERFTLLQKIREIFW